MAQETTHEIEARIEFVTAKSRLIEDNFTGVRYWLPKSQTLDFNDTGSDGLFIIVVTDWWHRKRDEFVVRPREE